MRRGFLLYAYAVKETSSRSFILDRVGLHDGFFFYPSSVLDLGASVLHDKYLQGLSGSEFPILFDPCSSLWILEKDNLAPFAENIDPPCL